MTKLRKLVSPSGVPILGTAEIVLGTAYLSGGYRDETGRLRWEYAGETKIHWDSQVTEQVDGKAVFVDELGNHWTEDQITLVDDETTEEE